MERHMRHLHIPS